MHLEPLICELLYDHDCVVLPDFGGLVANYRSARLNTRTHVISPPSKYIGFNRNLKNNDGLLVNHFAMLSGISYNESLSKVKQCIDSYHKLLNDQGRLVLDKIGVFFKDHSGQLQFIPAEQENFLLSSYGLRPVQLKFVGSEISEPETKIVAIQDEKRRNYGWKIAAAVGIPILIAGSLLLRNQAHHSDFTFASLNPFHKVRIDSDYMLKEFRFRPDSGHLRDEFSIASDSISGNFHFDFLRNKVSEYGIEIENTPKEITPPVHTEVKPVEEAKIHVEKNTDRYQYAVIGGAFAVPENAEKFLAKLKADGYDASSAGVKDGLHLVAYGQFSTKSEATEVLRKVKSSGGSAWIRKGRK